MGLGARAGGVRPLWKAVLDVAAPPPGVAVPDRDVPLDPAPVPPVALRGTTIGPIPDDPARAPEGPEVELDGAPELL